MKSPVTTILLTVGLALAGLSLVEVILAHRLPGNRQGYEPNQPIDFSHQLHAGELGMDCQYCHAGADESRHAGIPPAETCMNCHQTVTARRTAPGPEQADGTTPDAQPTVSPELRKLYDALALGEDLQPDPNKQPAPIDWVKVHQLPDFVYFSHEAHVNAGVDCQTCHGPVQAMERVRQVESLSMGWCVDCHRSTTANGVKGKPVHASTDCVTCHY